MIEFDSQNSFELENINSKKEWIGAVIEEEGKTLHELQYVFCTDEFLHKINVDFLNHNTLTDIITFDYTSGVSVSGEIYISIDRVFENAKEFNVKFIDELDRVIIHGVLHLCGYTDKTEREKLVMRSKEDYYLDRRGW